MTRSLPSKQPGILGCTGYNVFPNMTFLTNADHLTIMCSRPGPDPDHGELVMFLMTRMPPGAPRNKPTDVRMTAEGSEPGVVIT